MPTVITEALALELPMMNQRRQNLPNNDVSLGDDLTDQEVWVLKQWKLPTDRVHRPADYKRAGCVKDPGHAKRLRDLGILKPGHWLGSNTVFWYPVESARMLLSLPTERPPKAKPEQEPAKADAPEVATADDDGEHDHSSEALVANGTAANDVATPKKRRRRR
jgi:hypothetical protein